MNNDFVGTKVSREQLAGTFEAPEGEANLYYGLIRSGKTYGATADIHEELSMGRTVYATWPIKVEDFNDQKNFWFLFRNTFLTPWRKRFYYIPCSKNFHFIDAEKGEVDGVPTFNPNKPSEYIEYLNKLNHCSLYIDEAWRVIDSYKGTNFSVSGRDLILVTGHKFRRVNLIAQRPTSVHVTARGNMNRFYKFVKLGTFFGIPRFARYEFQEMAGETVDEMKEPISTKTYWGSKKIFNSYNSFFYGDLDPLHGLSFEAYDLNFLQKIYAFVKFFGGLKPAKRNSDRNKKYYEQLKKEQNPTLPF